ncbi:TetR/AcrR family transcriptional regulator [Colwellia psychrerythraea]|uniref:Transcriptional regulator, TetR family n=1 Tax=Colwellia psychrerythraea (strain 34H / ATCC BAA-681) TaxID=167879 RepID=Q485W2_COLP3|nr:TetR/AcrR family transcriptional regulator [Colwellia psychrerythraea]AAZ28440.1 transcriptional regulator, TetR family [Colwellia psychrerythraea 34H]
MSDAEQTRQNILTVAADEIHQHGFKATSLSVILNRCEISKGALYYHFTSKIELGYAVFEEVYTPMFLNVWQAPLTVDDPIEGLCDFLTSMTEEMSCSEVVCGCPLNNLCEEMANVDEGFRLRILCMQEQLNQLIVDALERISGDLRENLAFSQVGYFIVATLNGATSLSKSSRNKELFQQVIAELCIYIRALKK